MEDKKKDHKPGSGCNYKSQTNHETQNKLKKAEANVTLGPSAKISSPSSHDSTPNSTQQQQSPIVQWSYVPQNATEQFLSMHFPTLAPMPGGGALNQWQQLPPHPHQGQVFAQSTPPFWQPQPPAAAGPSLGANVPTQTFTDTGLHAHPVVSGGASSTAQTLVPNMCYPFGYRFPGFPSPWDPCSCLGQLYQMQHPYVYNFPSALNFSSATPRMPDNLASGEHSFQRGTIRPLAKISQKHQQFWDAQSVENVQLWSVINKLQAEVSDYKDRLKKLEEEVSSLKQKAEVATTEVTRTIPVGRGQPSKRGRPKRLHESHPHVSSRKAALSNNQFESKSPIFEEVILKKAENKEIAIRSNTIMVQQGGNEKNLNAVKDVSNNIQINQSNPIMSAYQGQLHKEYQGIQTWGNGPALSSTSGVNVNVGKPKDLKLAYSELSQPDKVLNDSMGVSAKYFGNTDDRNLGLTSSIPSKDTAKDLLDVAHQSLFHNSSFIQQGGNMTPEWNFATEEEASEELEDAIVGSAKDENEEEMEDDTSSGAEKIDATKEVGGCTMNDAMATSPKGLSPIRW